MADTTEPRDSDMTVPIGTRPADAAPATSDASSDSAAAAVSGPSSDTASDPAVGPAPGPAAAAPIVASGTTPPPVDPDSQAGRGWRDRVRGAGRRTLLGGAAAALVLLLLGGAGGFALARVADEGPGRGPGIGWHDRDADDRGGPGGMGPGGGPGGMLPPGIREESELDEDEPTT